MSVHVEESGAPPGDPCLFTDHLRDVRAGFDVLGPADVPRVPRNRKVVS